MKLPNNKIEVFNYRFLIKKCGLGLLLLLVLAGLFLNISSAQAFLDVPYNISAHQLNALDFMDSVPKHLLNIMLLAGEMSIFAIISGKLLDFASTQPVNLDNPLVNMGWGFTSGLVNISFILIFVVIALSYILKIDTFSMKKALPRLIMIALLINFSLLFVKMFVDIGWLIQNSFKEAFFVNSSLTASLIAPLIIGAKKVLVEIGGQLVAYAALGLVPFGPAIRMGWWLLVALPFETFFGSFSYAITLIIFGWIIGLIFLVYSILFLVRIAVFWFLAILAPLAFAAFILPQTEKFFKQWLNSLVQWSFLGIIPLFLAGMGIRLFTYLFPEIGPFSTTGASGANFNFVANYTRFVFLIIYLSAALMVSIKLAPKGTQIAFGLAETMLNRAGNFVSARATKRWGMKAKIWQDERIVKTDEELQRKTKAGIPMGRMDKLKGWGIRRMGGPKLAELEAKKLKGILLSEEKLPEDIDSLRTMLLQEGKKGPLSNKEKIAAVINKLADAGKIESGEEKFIADAIKGGANSKKILEIRPDLAGIGTVFKKSIEEVLASINPEDLRKKIQPDAFKSIEVLTHVLRDQAKIDEIGKNGSAKMKAEIINGIKTFTFPSRYLAEIQRTVNSMASDPKWRF